MKITGRRPALAAEHHAEMLEFRRIRRLARTVPPPRDLAARWGVSEQCARNYLDREYLPKHLAGLERG